MSQTATAGRAGWLRALALMFATWVLSPMSQGVLIAISFGLLVAFLPPRRLAGLILAVGGGILVVVGNRSSGLWYVERGWAVLVGGCFLALSFRWPEKKFFSKGLGAVVGAFLGMGLLFQVRPGDWSVVDWAVRTRIETTVSWFLGSVRANLGPEAVPAGLESQILETVASQAVVFPALLGLASLSALGLSWWLFHQISRRPGEAIGPLRDFRFNDQLVWVFLIGLTAFLATSGAMDRVGINAVVFMGALYALRGAAVLLFLKGGISFLGGLFMFLGFLVLAPYLILGAACVGLGDTWLDIRARRASTRPGT